jgi:hypothetical protein
LARVTPELASELAIHSESETFVEGTGRDVLCCDIKRNAAIEARRDCPYQCRRHAFTAVGGMYKQPGYEVASIPTKPNHAIVVLHDQHLRFPKDFHLGITIERRDRIRSDDATHLIGLGEVINVAHGGPIAIAVGTDSH